MAKKLPEILFARMDDEGYLIAESARVDAIEDDGPTVVGIYKLVSKSTLRKVVEADG